MYVVCQLGITKIRSVAGTNSLALFDRLILSVHTWTANAACTGESTPDGPDSYAKSDAKHKCKQVSLVAQHEIMTNLVTSISLIQLCKHLTNSSKSLFKTASDHHQAISSGKMLWTRMTILHTQKQSKRFWQGELLPTFARLVEINRSMASHIKSNYPLSDWVCY